MLTLQRRPLDGQSAVAGPSRLPAQSTIIQAPTPRRVRAKTRSPSYSPSDSDSDGPPSRPKSTPRPRATTTPSRPPSRTERRYRCIHIGCDKAYFKPSRLKEHELTHTGERPHPCPHCDQTYLRASHLTAHIRTHLPSSDRTFECTYKGCDKAFWTATHLKRHQAMHESTEAYPCPHCPQTFHKANQLRDHHALAHMPAGTKSFICTHDGCAASFSMRQQLKAHEKTHDATRYTCSHPSHDSLPSFPTWSALQSHLHTAHPPECPHPECAGRTFKSASKLKDHLKIHTLRAEDEARRTASEAEDGEGHGLKGKKRRRSSVATTGGMEGRGRGKLAKLAEAMKRAEKAGAGDLADSDLSILTTTSTTPNLAARAQPSLPVQSTFTPPTLPNPPSNQIDILTGLSTTVSVDTRRHGCPVSHLPQDIRTDAGNEGETLKCYARFWRVYDVRRHLKAAHGVDLEDEETRELLISAKEAEGGK